MRGSTTVRVAVAAAVAATLAVPATSTGATAPGRQASTWLAYWDGGTGYARVLEDADLFHTVSPFWYRASSCTAMESNPGAGSTDVVAGLRERGISVVPTITSTMPPAAAVACLGDAGQRAQHVARVLEVADRYDGVEFNYEHLALTTDRATGEQVRAAYSAFAADVCTALRERAKRCVHTVMPRTDESWSVWRGKLLPAVYDYRAIGTAADVVRVMAYDDNAPGTPPGPVAPWTWTQAVAGYTAATVPAGKGELGIPLYGRDWGGGRVATVTAPQAQALAQAYGVPVRWDDAQHAPTFQYSAGGATHTVWFNDARAVEDRTRLARSLGLHAAFWVVGQADGATWDAVRDVHTGVFWDAMSPAVRAAAEDLFARGVVQGTGGAFRAELPVTRGQLAAFLQRALQLPPASQPPPFDDLGDTTHRDAIAAVWEAGIASGAGDRTYAPHAPVTRGQMATFLARGFRLPPCEDVRFSDVAPDAPHAASICAVAAAGITQGAGDGTYRPGVTVNRGQMALLLTRALG